MNARGYKDLIQAFLDENLLVGEFETRYLTAFKNEPDEMDKQLFLILEDLFEDLDAYSPIWTQEDESPLRITEQRLRQEAAEALIQLEKYLLQNDKD
jgi:hypothetical protein